VLLQNFRFIAMLCEEITYNIFQVEELKQNLAARQIDGNRVQMLEAALRESEKDLKDMSEELELREVCVQSVCASSFIT